MSDEVDGVQAGHQVARDGVRRNGRRLGLAGDQHRRLQDGQRGGPRRGERVGSQHGEVELPGT